MTEYNDYAECCGTCRYHKKDTSDDWICTCPYSADEFYAECYYLYLFDKSWLKKQLPQTYQYIEKSLAKITPDRINRIYKTYSVIWK